MELLLLPGDARHGCIVRAAHFSPSSSDSAADRGVSAGPPARLRRIRRDRPTLRGRLQRIPRRGRVVFRAARAATGGRETEGAARGRLGRVLRALSPTVPPTGDESNARMDDAETTMVDHRPDSARSLPQFAAQRTVASGDRAGPPGGSCRPIAVHCRRERDRRALRLSRADPVSPGDRGPRRAVSVVESRSLDSPRRTGRLVACPASGASNAADGMCKGDGVVRGSLIVLVIEPR
jgi:hypothetical protein